MPLITQLRPGGLEASGVIPFFLLHEDIPAREQIDANYQHGGGWRPLKGWTFDREKNRIKYPGDPALLPHTRIDLASGEEVYIYPSAWVCIVQPGGAYEVARID